MEKLTNVCGRVVPLDRADVDTDQIIPARHLKRVDRDGLGRFAFEAWRGKPGFVFDRECYSEAPILLTGPNFGCGSSREHAPWALLDLGFRVIIAPSFADIFLSNCAKVGILTIELPAGEVTDLMQVATGKDGLMLEVDLPLQTLSTTWGRFASFRVEPFVKHCLVEGLDAVGLSLERLDEIVAHERARPSFLPATRGAT